MKFCRAGRDRGKACFHEDNARSHEVANADWVYDLFDYWFQPGLLSVTPHPSGSREQKEGVDYSLIFKNGCVEYLDLKCRYSDFGENILLE